MTIMAIADLNNDKFNDLVTIDSDGSTFTVHYFEESTLTYNNAVSTTLPTGLYVDSIMVMKSPQLYQSLLVVASEKSKSSLAPKTKMLVYDQIKDSQGTVSYFWKQSNNELNDVQIMTGSQPMLVDLNGD